ncbi:hypothetical protein HYT32_00160 [Candidatus Roizmanbacteria bacterium]|nr:hypothetical protein [Candidatus Roizmanbacteria bacterium]
MAKRGRPKKNNLITLLKKPEFWIGIFTVGLLIGIAGGLVLRNQSNLEINREQTWVSPAPKLNKLNYQRSQIPPAQKLAYTSSLFEAEVLENDSYWKIAQRECEDAKSNFITIQELNNNIRLYKGMIVKVVCE